MMKKLFFAVMAMAVMPAAAQDTYESARLLGSDLNGTARYVGMGGAMDALGADISTIATNPAGVGMFRHSNVSLGFGFVSQQDVEKFDGLGKTNMSFDQIGFVYSSRLSRSSFVNVAFNYHKSRNFDQILSAANALGGSSQNGLTYYKAEKGIYDLDLNKQGEVIGYDNRDNRAWAYSEADYMNANVLMLDPNDGLIYDMGASAYSFDRAHRGWISDFDVNVSGNVNDRFYWGLTVGIKDVNYKGYSEYAESLVNSDGTSCGSMAVGDERKIKGSGLELKAGIIFRPLEESPFRMGLSVATPTWYNLTSSNDSYMLNNSDYGSWDEGRSHESYDFKFYTPWKFGLSLGHTIGSQIALGLGYEYMDYSASNNRVNEGGWYDDRYGDYYTRSHTDVLMKENTEHSLTGQHTIKAGVEFKPVPELAVRFGYNYLSSPYEERGYRDMTLDSPGVSYASTTDYVNWKDTHRITCGLGVKAGGLNVDLAYQYSGTKGDFHPFQPYAGDTGVKEVSNNRHQVLLTLGYTF